MRNLEKKNISVRHIKAIPTPQQTVDHHHHSGQSYLYNFKMYKSLLSLALVPSLVAARTVNVRRGVDCSFETAASTGDTCDSFSSSWGITVEKLKALNPGQVDCTNFDINKSYCVIGEVNNTPVTTTSSAKPSTTKPTASATPTTKPNTPTQDGIAKDCDKFHKVVSGDQCDAIESKYSISQEQFLKWNPAINARMLQPLLFSLQPFSFFFLYFFILVFVLLWIIELLLLIFIRIYRVH